MARKCEETAPEGSSGPADWQNKFGTVVVVGIVALVYGLVTSDWAFAITTILGCVIGMVIVATVEGLLAAKKRRRGAGRTRQ